MNKREKETSGINYEQKIESLLDQLRVLVRRRDVLSNQIYADSEITPTFVREHMQVRNEIDEIQTLVGYLQQKQRSIFEDEQKQAGEVEHKRKVDLFEQLKTNLPKCPDCDQPLRLTEGVDQPSFDLPVYMTMVTKNTKGWSKWWVDVSCPKRTCGFRTHLYPDKPGALEQLKKRPKSLGDNLPVAVG